MESVQAIKQRFGIIGNDPKLNLITKMTCKKLMILIIVGLILTGCNSDDGPVGECDPEAERTEQWEQLDCDDDCRTNGEEVADGTDPFDSQDFLGKGNALTEILMTSRGGNVIRRFVFNPQLNRLEAIYDKDGIIFSQFTYDMNNRLTEVFHNVPNSSFDETTTYIYNNDQISQITLERSGTTLTKYVTYDGNKITTSFTTVPGNPPFSERYEINPSNGRVLHKEAYYYKASDWFYASTEYNYDATGLSLIDRYSDIYRYDLSTGTIDLTNDYYVERFEYSETTNPAFNLLDDIYLNIILEEDIDKGFWNPVTYGLLSEHFCTRSAYGQDGVSAFYPAEVGCVQNNGLIYKAYQYGPYDYDNDIDYIYQ